MIEATLGTVILIFAALAAVQIVLVFHGALAAKSAATRAARTYAITNDLNEADRTAQRQYSTALAALKWEPAECDRSSGMAHCKITVTIPEVVPGGGLFAGGSVLSQPTRSEEGWYPIGARNGF
jgi:Flp pilus assembly protein TadG